MCIFFKPVPSYDRVFSRAFIKWKKFEFICKLYAVQNKVIYSGEIKRRAALPTCSVLKQARRSETAAR